MLPFALFSALLLFECFSAAFSKFVDTGVPSDQDAAYVCEWKGSLLKHWVNHEIQHKIMLSYIMS